MKKYIIILFAIASVLLWTSCEKEKTGPVFQNTKAPAINVQNDGTAYVLSDDIADDTLAIFTWTKAEYNVNTEISYVVQVDLASNNFSNPATIGTTSKDSLTITVFNINKILQ